MSANEKKWDAFLAKHGMGRHYFLNSSSSTASDEEIFMHKKNLKFLAREGIPPHHRPRVWEISLLFSFSFIEAFSLFSVMVCFLRSVSKTGRSKELKARIFPVGAGIKVC